MSTKDKVFDPFCGDPADVGPVKPEKCNFNPDVSPFTPSLDLSSWQVVAAEYTGKAVAVMLGGGDNKLHVCTSPSFNSKCRHPGLPCLDWDNVRLAPAQGSQPDSGLDNTDQNSEERDRIARVAQWSADAARQTEAARGGDWSEPTFQADNGSPVWAGETQFVQWSQVSGQTVEQQQYNNLQITVEYHTPTQDNLYSPVEEPLVARSGFGNDPLYVCHDQQAVSDDSWACGLGVDFSRLNMDTFSGAAQVQSLADISQDELAEQERIREEFKSKIFDNIGINKQQTEDGRKREEFKKKILSNLGKADLSVKCDKPVPDNEDDRIRNDFKNKILSNLNGDK